MSAGMRDALLRLCLRAYPRAVRERDADAILDLARELVEEGASPVREGVGLLASGTSLRLRSAGASLTGAPWRAARARLALPLAAALFAVAATWAGRSGLAHFWVGWSVFVTFAAAGLALAGAAAGHRWLTAAGALVATGMLGLDALRDHYGRGSRFHSEVGSALFDVLVMWIPAGLLLLVCAGALQRVPTERAIWRLAWGLVPGGVLLVLASEPARVVIADRIVLFGGFVAAVLVGLAMTRRPADPVLPLIAALILAVVAAPALWIVASFLPPPASGAPPMALAYFAAGALATAGAMVLLAGLSRRRSS